jgi:hypothetical protein
MHRTGGAGQRAKTPILAMRQPVSMKAGETKMDRIQPSEVVVITGASAGLGRATARRFAQAKAKIGLWREELKDSKRLGTK